MKEVALLCVVLFLAGCSTSGSQWSLSSDKLYVGVGDPVDGTLSADNAFTSIQEAQLAANGKPLLETEPPSGTASGPFQVYIGHQTMKHLDLEATLYTSAPFPHRFSSHHTVYDPRYERPPIFGRRIAAVTGELEESGAMLTAIPKWNFNEYFGVYARLGGSYTRSNLKVSLGERTPDGVDCIAVYTSVGFEIDCGSGTVVSRARYRADGFRPVWGVGISIANAIRIEYQTRQIPIASDSETLHSILITAQIGLKILRE